MKRKKNNKTLKSKLCNEIKAHSFFRWNKLNWIVDRTVRSDTMQQRETFSVESRSEKGFNAIAERYILNEWRREKNGMVPSLSVHFGRKTTECFVYCVLFIIKKKCTNGNRNLPNIILHVLVCCHCHLYAHKLEHFTLSTLGLCMFFFVHMMAFYMFLMCNVCFSSEMESILFCYEDYLLFRPVIPMDS